MSNLNINEAIVTVNKSNFAGPVDLYYRNIECSGCPLDKLTTLKENSQDIVLDTRYGLQFEFRPDDSRPAICFFDQLNLNSHGHYRIDISVNTSEPNAKANCDLTVLHRGECLLCPFAILLCFLFAVTALDKLYEWIRTKKQLKINDETVEDVRSESRQEQIAAASTGQISKDLPDLGNKEGSDILESRGKNDTAVYVTASPTEAQESPRKNKRIDALDAFRGLTIAGMIMVNYGGAGYMILEHKPWDGLTLADFVFPFFIFSMGASIALSMKSILNQYNFTSVILKIIRRSTILLALGLALNSMWLNDRSLHHLRLTGVLQRFSISYLVVAMTYALELYLNKWLKQRATPSAPSPGRPLSSKITGTIIELATASSCLSIYIYVTYFLSYSTECPIGYVGPGGKTDGGQLANCTGGAAAWLDHTLLGNSHLYNDTELQHVFGTNVSHDPEGLLGKCE